MSISRFIFDVSSFKLDQILDNSDIDIDLFGDEED